MTDTTPTHDIVDETLAHDTEPSVPAAPDAEARVIELVEQVRRARADYDNLRKRFDREVTRERAAERSRVAAAWLPVLDDLERALEHTSVGTQTMMSGVGSIRDQALAVLAGLGYHRFEVVGEPFDPSRHEAMGTIDSPSPAGAVAVQVRAGYGSENEVLRPAGVLVSTGIV